MSPTDLVITYINGPTALIELGGLALLTDPTFDPAGTDYPTPEYTLHKTTGPALAPERVPAGVGILLSHDHHFDNLDHQGRALLSSASAVYTTKAGAERLGGNAIGMAPWQAVFIPLPHGGDLTLTATPCRHGPPGGDRGPVIGFVLEGPELPTLYFSGDTVWYDEGRGHRRPVRYRYGVLEHGRRQGPGGRPAAPHIHCDRCGPVGRGLAQHHHSPASL